MDPSERKAMIKATFDTVAAGYDHPALRFFPESARCLVDVLAPAGGEHVLDVATGTGSVALALAARLPRGRVTAIDFSTGMLAEARAKAAARGAGNVDFVEMDMQSVAFPHASFDDAVCAFGIFFVDDMAAQLRHIAERVRPGGKIAVCGFYEDAFLPLAELFLARMERYGVERPPLSWKRIGNETLARTLFESAGLERIHIERRNLGYYLADAGDWWQVIWNAGFRGLVSQLAPAERVRFQEEHLAEVRTYCRAEGLWLDVKVIYALGIVPAA